MSLLLRKFKSLVFTLLISPTPITLQGQEAAVESTPNSAQSSRARATFQFLSHLLEHGYSQTNYNSAINTQISYQWPQFEIGIRGHNAYFPGESVHLCIQPYLGILAATPGNTKLAIYLQNRNYYSDNKRQTNNTLIAWKLAEWVSFAYESMDNWYGLGFGKNRIATDFNFILANWGKLGIQLGYNLPDKPDEPNYLDLTANLKHQTSMGYILFELMARSNTSPRISQSDQFFAVLGLGIDF